MTTFSSKNFNTTKTARIHKAFGAALSLNVNATQAEVEQKIDAMIIELVLHQEKIAKIKELVDDPM